MFARIREWFNRGLTAVALAIAARIDDSNNNAGWNVYGRNLNELSQAEQLQQYQDTITAWRKNPIARRAIDLTSDFVIGDRIAISSPHTPLQQFIQVFWNHRKNRMDNRLQEMCDELTRAGDLFPVLFRNSQDGMSYIRFVTKDQIDRIQTKANDWETEMVIIQKPTSIEEDERKWYTVENGRSRRATAIILHYHVNRPMGAIFGEGDLASVLPWLRRYSRMLEGRIRLHWAARAFMWFVKVPTKKVEAKRAQYANPPEAGSIVVHDDSEEWKVESPNLRGTDAAPDMKAIRRMINAGIGFPAHWLGEGEDVNHATAEAMQAPTERHLKRRQNYFTFMLSDIIYHAYQRAHQLLPDIYPALPTADYDQLFNIETPDISKTDNLSLAEAAKAMMEVVTGLNTQYPSEKLKMFLLSVLLKVAGVPQKQEFLDEVMKETAVSNESSTANSGDAAAESVTPRRDSSAAVSQNGANHAA